MQRRKYVTLVRFIADGEAAIAPLSLSECTLEKVLCRPLIVPHRHRVATLVCVPAPPLRSFSPSDGAPDVVVSLFRSNMSVSNLVPSSVAACVQSLVQRHHPRLVRKLLQLGVQPLQLAMPWIQFGFVTYLEVDQASLCTTTCSSSSCDLFFAPPSATNDEGIR